MYDESYGITVNGERFPFVCKPAVTTVSTGDEWVRVAVRVVGGRVAAVRWAAVHTASSARNGEAQ